MQYLLSNSGPEFRELFFFSVSTFGWIQHANNREKKKNRKKKKGKKKKALVSTPASTVSVLNHEKGRLLMRLIHIMMYFTSYSQQIHCNMSFFMYHERYMSTQAYRGWGSLWITVQFCTLCWRRKNWKFTQAIASKPSRPRVSCELHSNKCEHYKTCVLKLISKEVSHFIATRIRDSKVIFTLFYIS